MSLLSTITRGRENRPPRLFVYGQEGVGKSLFSASAFVMLDRYYYASIPISRSSKIRWLVASLKAPEARRL